MNINLTPLLKSIFDYDPDGPNIHHLMAVHGYSRLIAQMENVDGHTLFITEVAADSGFKIFSKTGKRLSQDFKRAEANVS